MRFQALLPFSFCFICTLQWCKHCSRLVVAPNFRKFPLTAQCGFDGRRVVSRPVFDDTLFVPTQILHFQAFLPLSFIFICTLYWCKRCTELEVARNLRKFPLSVLRGNHAERVVSWPVLYGTPFAPTQGLIFLGSLLLSFPFICTSHWYKHCTGLDVAPNLRKFPLTALCGIDSERVVSRPVLDGTLLALTQIFHFRALLPLTFIFICTLH